MSRIVLSDVHLRDSHSVKSKIVIRFLQEVASRFDHIYVLGDLFDIWPGTNPYLVKTFGPVLRALGRLVSEGRRVYYIEGNHDFLLGSYFSEELGIEVYPDKLVEDWNGRRIYLTHGDLANPREYNYQILRKILRNGVVQKLFQQLPPEWVFRAGLKSSQFSRNHQRKMTQSEAAIRGIYRESAFKLLREGYDVVLMGHTHLPDDVSIEVEGRACRYINTGDWIRHFSYLEFDGSQFYTRFHPVKNL